MDEEAYREHLLAEMRGIATALLALGEAYRELAGSLKAQGRQGTLRIRVETPTQKRRKKVRVRQ